MPTVNLPADKAEEIQKAMSEKSIIVVKKENYVRKRRLISKLAHGVL